MNSQTYSPEALRFKPHNSWNFRYPDELEDFHDDTTNHVLKIIKADGLYNHLSLYSPQSSEYSFEVITTPGQLMVRGDMGTVVFAREPDMLKFMDTAHRHDIDPQYWSSKTEAFDKDSSITEFSGKKFVHFLLHSFWESSRHQTAKDTKRAWSLVIEPYLRRAECLRYEEGTSVEEAHEEVAEILAGVARQLQRFDIFPDLWDFDEWEVDFFEEWFDYSKTFLRLLYAAHYASQNYMTIFPRNTLK